MCCEGYAHRHHHIQAGNHESGIYRWLDGNLTSNGDKVNDWLIPRTLRINDKAIDAAKDAEFVDFIFSKTATQSQYDTVCYAASDAALPECVKPLLTENLLPQFTMETETLQPV